MMSILQRSVSGPLQLLLLGYCTSSIVQSTEQNIFHLT
jgi:hypothetical protein